MSNPLGQLSKLEVADPRVLREALELCREGHHKTTVAGALGVSVDSLDRWIARPDDDAVYGAFARAWRQAEAIAKIESARKCRSLSLAAKNEQWFAERRWPLDFGARQKVEHTGEGGGAIRTEVVARVVELPALEPDAPPASQEPGDADR